MKVTEQDKNYLRKEVPFSKILKGRMFFRNGALYLKIHDVRYHSKPCNAICLKYPVLEYFEESDRVYKVNPEIIIK